MTRNKELFVARKVKIILIGGAAANSNIPQLLWYFSRLKQLACTREVTFVLSAQRQQATQKFKEGDFNFLKTYFLGYVGYSHYLLVILYGSFFL